jgi:hypothetical protein
MPTAQFSAMLAVECKFKNHIINKDLPIDECAMFIDQLAL